jgi:CheY-like chemotaxis protein
VRYNIQKTCQCGTRYKLILMDLNMPVMDGYKASREIIRMHKL